MGTRILLVDDEPASRAALGHLVAALGHDGVLASDAEEALDKLNTEDFDLCLADVQPEGESLALLEAARAHRPPVPVVALTGEGSVKSAVAALRAGAVDFLSKPFHAELFNETLRRALANVTSNDGRPTEGATVVSEHPAMRLMLERIDQVADTDANVLIRGENGTGKQLIARLVHASSVRRAGPFVAVNLAELPESLAEAELFGDDKREGRIAAAQHGTLFLDEVGAFPKALQSKLLHVLQEREVIPVGGGSPVPVNARIIAATSRNLEQLVREGTLRDDLYYRLDVIPIEVPALRDRPDDIPVLADHVRREVNARAGLSVPALSAEVTKRLASYEWPGNIRQLETTVERLVVQASDRAITVNDLPTNLRADVVELGVSIVDLPPYGVDLRLLLTRLEDRLIGQALERTGGNKNRAAELLGMNRTTLVEKLRRRNVA
jgi:DNA-binding NtrC family response regulator